MLSWTKLSVARILWYSLSTASQPTTVWGLEWFWAGTGIFVFENNIKFVFSWQFDNLIVEIADIFTWGLKSCKCIHLCIHPSIWHLLSFLENIIAEVWVYNRHIICLRFEGYERMNGIVIKTTVGEAERGHGIQCWVAANIYMTDSDF